MKKKVKWLFVGMMSIVLLVGCSEKEETVPVKEQQVQKWQVALEQTEGTKFIYSIENTTNEEVAYTFANSMQMDYTLYKAGEKQYTQSEVVSFAQVLTQLTLAANEKHTYEIVLEDLDSGNYQLDVWLTPNEMKEESKQTITFKVE